MNKKFFTIILVITCILSFSFGKDRMNISTYALLESKKSGGGIGFSFPIFQKNDFFIRNEINTNLYFSNTPLSEANLITVGDKLFFGSLKEINGFGFRSYGYCKCEFGPSWSKTCSIFNTAPLILEMGGAGGFEFIYSKRKSFFIEFGGGASIKSFLSEITLDDFASGSFKGGYVCITAGAKIYMDSME